MHRIVLLLLAFVGLNMPAGEPSTELRYAPWGEPITGWSLTEQTAGQSGVKIHAGGRVTFTEDNRTTGMELRADINSTARREAVIAYGGRGKIAVALNGSSLPEVNCQRWPELFFEFQLVSLQPGSNSCRIVMKGAKGTAFGAAILSPETAMEAAVLSGRATVARKSLLAQGEAIEEGFPGIVLAGGVDVSRMTRQGASEVGKARNVGELRDLLQQEGVYRLSATGRHPYQQSVVVGVPSKVLADLVAELPAEKSQSLEIKRAEMLIQSDNSTEELDLRGRELADRLAIIASMHWPDNAYAGASYPTFKSFRKEDGTSEDFLISTPRPDWRTAKGLLFAFPATRDSVTGLLNSYTLRYGDVVLATSVAAERLGLVVVWSNLADHNHTNASMERMAGLMAMLLGEANRERQEPLPAYFLGFCAGATDALMQAARYPGAARGVVAFTPPLSWWNKYSEGRQDEYTDLRFWLRNSLNSNVVLLHGTEDAHVGIASSKALVSLGLKNVSLRELLGTTESHYSSPLGSLIFNALVDAQAPTPSMPGVYVLAPRTSLVFPWGRISAKGTSPLLIEIGRSTSARLSVKANGPISVSTEGTVEVTFQPGPDLMAPAPKEAVIVHAPLP